MRTKQNNVFMFLTKLRKLCVAEMAGTARHSTRLHSADIHGAQKTPSDTVSRLCSLLLKKTNSKLIILRDHGLQCLQVKVK